MDEVNPNLTTELSWLPLSECVRFCCETCCPTACAETRTIFFNSSKCWTWDSAALSLRSTNITAFLLTPPPNVRACKIPHEIACRRCYIKKLCIEKVLITCKSSQALRELETRHTLTRTPSCHKFLRMVPSSQGTVPWQKNSVLIRIFWYGRFVRLAARHVRPQCKTTSLKKTGWSKTETKGRVASKHKTI